MRAKAYRSGQVEGACRSQAKALVKPFIFLFGLAPMTARGPAAMRAPLSNPPRRPMRRAMTGSNNQTGPTTPRSLDDLKAQAKRLRAALAEDGDFISHSEALELLAKQLGFRDWNTLHAAIGNRPAPLQLGDRIAGAYLGQPFEGEIIAVEALSGGRRRITIDFDEAVDVVTFESFSAFRKRVTAVIDEDGKSAEKTSDGRPQMELKR